jgi:hypothetical protein
MAQPRARTLAHPSEFVSHSPFRMRDLTPRKMRVQFIPNSGARDPRPSAVGAPCLQLPQDRNDVRAVLGDIISMLRSRRTYCELLRNAVGAEASRSPAPRRAMG